MSIAYYCCTCITSPCVACVTECWCYITLMLATSCLAMHTSFVCFLHLYLHLHFIFKYLVVFILMDLCYLWLPQSISPQIKISWLANIATFREMQINVHCSLRKKKKKRISTWYWKKTDIFWTYPFVITCFHSNKDASVINTAIPRGLPQDFSTKDSTFFCTSLQPEAKIRPQRQKDEGVHPYCFLGDSVFNLTSFMWFALILFCDNHLEGHWSTLLCQSFGIAHTAKEQYVLEPHIYEYRIWILLKGHISCCQCIV